MMDDKLHRILTQARIPQLASLLSPGEECFLVGGALRDWRLGLSVTDFDFATPFDPSDLAREFAQTIDGHWFMLDVERRQSRVVAKGEDAPLTSYDFAPFRAPDLNGDLLLRDFTINAVALSIREKNAESALIDPLAGLNHIQYGILRACSSGVFQDDPLRVIKGIRHCASLGFIVEPHTLARMREAATSLPRIAAERVRAELAGIFAGEAVTRGLLLMRELGLVEEIFGSTLESGSFQEGLERLERAAEVVRSLAALDRPQCLDRELEGGLSRRALLKMAAFLHGYRPADTAAFAQKWRFSRNTAALLKSLAALGPEHVEELGGLTSYRRGRALWAAGLGPSPCDHLAFLPNLMDEPPPQAVEKILPVFDDLRAVSRNGRIPDLVDGDWIGDHLGLQGPAVGRALNSLRMEEIAGRVKTEEEAKNFLRTKVYPVF